MDPVQVNGIGLQPLEAFGDMGVDVFGVHTGNTGVEVGVRSFGPNRDALPHARFIEPFADHLFAISVAAVIT